MATKIREGVLSLTGLMPIRKKNRTYYYYRKKGRPLVKLPDISDPGFLAAYERAVAAQPPRKIVHRSGTLEALCEAVMRSEGFLTLSVGYRRAMRRNIEEIMVQSEGYDLEAIVARDIRDDLSALAPNAALQRLKAWRYLYAFAVQNGLADDDPTLAVKPPKQPKTDGHMPWTAPEIAAYRSRWPIGTTKRAAMELLHWTGARIKDAVALGPGMVRRGVLVFRQAKTGEDAYVPWTCSLPDYAADMESDRDMMHEALGCLSGQMTFLATHGRTRSEKALGNMVREAARACGVEKSAHGLRKTRATVLAENGATTHEIASWTGHKTLKEVARYTEKADRMRAVMGTNNERTLQTMPRKVKTHGARD